MNDSEDPIIAALADHDDKLDWLDRKDLCPKGMLARGVARLKFFVLIVVRMFISANL